jgi:transcription initiation factor IIF auxiliary subunit
MTRLTFSYGNTHSLTQGEMVRHRWTMFFALNDNLKETGDFVKEITYYIHPTFKPDVIKVTEAPFLLSRTGWGFFEVFILVKF